MDHTSCPYWDPLFSDNSAIYVSAGFCHTCALKYNSKIVCWGCNDHGQLGIGNNRGKGLYKSDMGDSLSDVNLGTGNENDQLNRTRQELLTFETIYAN